MRYMCIHNYTYMCIYIYTYIYIQDLYLQLSIYIYIIIEEHEEFVLFGGSRNRTLGRNGAEWGDEHLQLCRQYWLMSPEYV